METQHRRKRRKRRESKKVKGVVRLIFFAYVGFMVWLLFVLGMENSSTIMMDGAYNLNIIPFKTINVYIEAMKSTTSAFVMRQIFVGLAANVVLFIPLGFFLPWIWKKLRSFFKTFGVIVLVILGIELVQLMTLVGSCDIDDFLLNTLGALIGYLIWIIFKKKTNK